jgi:uncharacterized repeat protein (TIGR03833 family)
MNGQQRDNIKAGLKVAIVLKKDQRSGKLTQGVVKDLLTNSSFHPHGIKVRLETFMGFQALYLPGKVIGQHDDGDIVFFIVRKYIVGDSGKAQIGNFYARFFQGFSSGTSFPIFPLFQVTAGKTPAIISMDVFSFSQKNLSIF